MVWRVVCLLLVVIGYKVDAKPRRVLYDTDVNSDDLFALLYLLKQNISEIDLKAITVSANGFSNAGHAINHLYDILYMMDRDDIPVGVGGDGGILPNGTILPDVGGYLPLIEQRTSTVGDCRYRQAINKGHGGLLDIDGNYGLRRGFLPQGHRHYSPLRQPSTQQVMIDTISAGPTTVLATGSSTNLAIFLATNPNLKKNIEHIYVMGGSVRLKSEIDCCPENGSSSSCRSEFCGYPGNLFTGHTSNPYAEFNVFLDPFAAYQVVHSGIPVTLIPLDATETIPITGEFFSEFAKQQATYEAQYCFRTLKIVHDTWSTGDLFFKTYFMWDSFAAGVMVSEFRNEQSFSDDNEFADMEYLNLTVVTSNKPYGVYDGSNPFFDGLAVPRFQLQKNGAHSGHVQYGIHDPFCRVDGNEKGLCQDGYTKEVTDPDAVRVLVAMKAKPNRDTKSPLNREFFKSFLDVVNLPQQTGRFNLSTEFPYYREIQYKPDFTRRRLGRPIVFDMDLSAGDFLALIYLLKVPVEQMDLKAIFVNCNGWGNPATIDIVYDVLHMMGRDDIPVGLGTMSALWNPSFSCKYEKVVPNGSGGRIDTDTLFGLARRLPRSPRRCTAETSVNHGDPRNSELPELRQPLVSEVWKSISRKVDSSKKITMLTNGPLTNLANIILSGGSSATSIIQNVVIVGGNIINKKKKKQEYLLGVGVDTPPLSLKKNHKKKKKKKNRKGNIFTFPENKYGEFNMFLDPAAAKTVIESELDITLIPLNAQRKASSFPEILKILCSAKKTPELVFARRLLSRLYKSQNQSSELYHHMDMFLGEILGAVFLADHHHHHLKPILSRKHVNVLAGDQQKDGWIIVDEEFGKAVNVLENLDTEAYYSQFADLLGAEEQSAVIVSYDEQKRMWRRPPNDTNIFVGIMKDRYHCQFPI